MTMNAPNDETAPRHTTAILAIILISPARVGAYLARLLYLGAMIGFFYFCT